MPAARRLRALILAPVQAPAAAAQAPDPNVVEPSPEESALADERSAPTLHETPEGIDVRARYDASACDGLTHLHQLQQPQQLDLIHVQEHI